MKTISQMPEYPKRGSISLRLLFLVVLCSSFFTLMASIYQLYFYYQDDVDSIHDNLEFLQKSYLLPISGSLYSLDYEQLDLLLQSVIQLQDLEYIEILETRGSKEIKRSVGNPDTRKDIVRKFPLVYFTPVSNKSYTVGTLTVTAGFENIYRRTLEKALVVIATNAVKMFLTSFCIMMIFQSTLTRHLVGIAKFTQQMELKKQYVPLALDRKTESPSKPDEFDQVVGALNNMQERISLDIEKRENAEEQLRKSEKKYHSLFTSVNEGVCLHSVVYDQQGQAVNYRILEVNSAYETITGIKQEDTVGRLSTEIYGQENPPYWDIFLKVADTGEPVSFETFFPPMEKHFKISVFSPGAGQFATLFADITEQKKAEDQIKSALKEKEVLLREIHHRTKNNMQVLSSLLALQADRVNDQKYVDLLKDSQERIRSMALIHEKLYQSKDFSKIDFNAYVETLVNGLVRSFAADPDKIVVKMEIEDILIGIDNGIPCGLIINELVSNSLKYAFSHDRSGVIIVTLCSINENEVELTVSDDGIGIPEDLDFRNTESLGLHLVKILAERQLHGEIKLNGTKGTKFHIRFKAVPDQVRI